MAHDRHIKTEHSGAKNGDKIGTREEVKRAAKKLRRQTDRRVEELQVDA